MATNPDSWLHVSRRADDQAGSNPQAVIQSCAEALDRLLAADAYAAVEEPTFYLYRYREEGHQQTGLVAAIPIAAFLDGRVLGHEHVEPHRVRALVAHQSQLSMRGDLVALLYPDDRVVDSHFSKLQISSPDVEIPGPLHHEIWKVDSAENQTISAAFEITPLYLIDGHHRVAAAIEEWNNLGKPENFTVLCLLTPQSQLRSLSFDRRVVGPIIKSDWLNALGAQEVKGPFRRKDEVCIYFNERWWSVTLQPGAPGVANVDVIRLHEQILKVHFGITDFANPLLEVTSQRVDADVLRYRCDNDGGAAFIIWPPSVSEIIEVANRGEQLPPKSSYFDPKPWSGVFVCAPVQ